MSEQHSTADTESVTLINVFEIPRDQIDTFMEGWTERARIMSTHPGFRDAVLHRALSPDDRFQLVNVAHWDSLENYTAAHTDARFQASRETARRNSAVTATPQLYRAVAGYTLSPGAQEPVPIKQN